MTGPDMIKKLCDDYISAAEELERNRKPADGLFGIGSKPADDPCHDRFAEDFEKKINKIASEKPVSGEVRDMLSYIYHLPCEHREYDSIFWMLCAVHGMTLPLIPLLDKDDAKEICRQYASDFRRWERLPAQEKVYKALKKS